MAPPRMPVRSTNPRRLHINHGTVEWTVGRRQLRDVQRRTNRVEDNSTHSPVLPAEPRCVGARVDGYLRPRWCHVFRRVPAAGSTARYAAAWATDYSCDRSVPKT
jgi:hypothetical protein